MKQAIIFLSIICCVVSCIKPGDGFNPPPIVQPPNTIIPGLSDTLATPETKALYAYLKDVSGKGLLFGQQYSTYFLQNSVDELCTKNISDCFTSVGQHPAILGVNYTDDAAMLKAHIINTFRQGGVINVHWTFGNPLVPGSDHHNLTPGAVASIIKGGSKYEFYKQTLTTMAQFYKSLVYDGKLIPIIFRPYHENYSSDKWWRADLCTPQEYIALYRETVSYLRDSLGVHNLLFAYAPNTPSDNNINYIDRYPGDDVIDIIGFDRYGGAEDVAKFSNNLVKDCQVVVNFAEARNKVAAITEAGVGNGIQNTNVADWFTKAFNPVMNDPVAKKVAYWLTWRNKNPNNYWIPLPGQFTYNDFVTFYNNPYTLFLNDLPKDIYVKTDYN